MTAYVQHLNNVFWQDSLITTPGHAAPNSAESCGELLQWRNRK